MQIEPFRTQINQRVEIKPEVTSIYPAARVYMQGWVRGQKRDELEYPMIFVEWDKNHWAYSGEADGWTLEAHFNPVEEKKMMEEFSKKTPDDEPELKSGLPSELEDALFNAMSRAIEEFKSKDATSVERKHNEESPSEEISSYEETLQEAFELASTGEAFYIIVAKRHKQGGQEIVIPHVANHYRRQDSMAIVEASMADLAAQAHALLAYDYIRNLKDDTK